MRRALILTGTLVLAALPATPAYAVTNTICVGVPVGACTSTVASIQVAITTAATDGADSVILIGPGVYTDGPYSMAGTVSQDLTVRGSGPTTVLTLPEGDAEVYVLATDTTISDLTVEMSPLNPTGDEGISVAEGSRVEDVSIDGTGVASAIGLHSTQSTVTGVTVAMTGGGSRAVLSEGDNLVSDSTFAGHTAYFMAPASDAGVDALTRLTLRPTEYGLLNYAGVVTIDDSLIDLGANPADGLVADNPNPSSDLKTITADHVTIVGGSAGSRGAWANATAVSAIQTSTINLTNSIVHGPALSLVVEASNMGPPGPSNATINVSYSAYESTTTVTDPVTGSGGIFPGAGIVTADPQLTGAGDFHPVAASPVIDAGNPVAGGPATDLEGSRRVQDGNADGIDRRDMGAYERADTVAPETTITGGPTGLTNDATPTFTFTSDPGATYFCQLDVQAEVACTSPVTFTGVANGAHTVRVRAIDTALNAEPVPAERAFVVDTVAPSATLVRKPGKKTSARKAKFTFVSSDPSATFECRLDKKPFRPCVSPVKLKVKLGKHTFSVLAIDAAGNRDATPTVYKFKRIIKPKG